MPPPTAPGDFSFFFFKKLPRPLHPLDQARPHPPRAGTLAGRWSCGSPGAWKARPQRGDLPGGATRGSSAARVPAAGQMEGVPPPVVLPLAHLPFKTRPGEGAGSLRQRAASREESLCHPGRTARGGRGRRAQGRCGALRARPSREAGGRPSAEPAAAALPLVAPCARRAPAAAPTRPRRCRRAAAGYTSSSSELMCKICCAASSGEPSGPCQQPRPSPRPLRAPHRRLSSAGHLRTPPRSGDPCSPCAQRPGLTDPPS